MDLYRPKMYQKDIFSIDYNKLLKRKIKYLIFDLDNTLGLIEDEVCDKKTENFINDLSKRFIIIIASNNNYKRVSTYAKNLKADIFSFAMKPSGKIYRRMKSRYTGEMSEVCIIGDQIVTDIIVGNRFGMFTILVDPKGKKDLKITNLNRFLEKRMMKEINFVRGEYYEKK